MIERKIAVLALGVLLAGCTSASGNGATDATPTPGFPSPTPEPTAHPPATGVGNGGGTVDNLAFAVVGDTRPALPDDLSGYPSAVITKIYQDIEAESPHPDFVLATGDYILADPWTGFSDQQLDLYLTARHGFTGTVFYALGNHECMTLTNLNCLASNLGGLPNSFLNFMAKMDQPMGYQKPYYSVEVDAADGSWTSKFVLIAGNAWDSVQAAWLDSVLSEPTTYTFVVRHEDHATTDAPAVVPSEQIIGRHPFTLKLVGHVHTFSVDLPNREVITGNGGAPLGSSVDYGYTVIQRRSDGVILGSNYDYQSHATIGSFAVHADGSPAS